MSAQSITAQADHVRWAFLNGREYEANRMSFSYIDGSWRLQAFANISDDSRVMIVLVIHAPEDSPFRGSVMLAPFSGSNRSNWLGVYEEVSSNYFEMHLTEGHANVEIFPDGVSTGDFTVTVLDPGLELSGSFSITPGAPYAEFDQVPSDSQGTRSSALTQPS